jgi:DNA-3-methyladenine glycosylase
MIRTFNTIKRDFYDRDTLIVARDLLGKVLVRYTERGYVIGVITETEAYTDDQASHAFAGQTKRNGSMFGPVGHAYVYFTYGIHYCMNVVARDTKNSLAGAVLIRALVPLEGREIIIKNRKGKLPLVVDGPGKLTQAFEINAKCNNLDLTSSDSGLFIVEGPSIQDRYVSITPRIGISQAKDLLWRFAVTQEGEKVISSQCIKI